MPTMTIDIAELAAIVGENAELKKRVDELLESNTRYLEERRLAQAHQKNAETSCLAMFNGRNEFETRLHASSRALTELAQAASLVIAEWDLGDVSPAYETLAEDIERLRARLTEHMPVIEVASLSRSESKEDSR